MSENENPKLIESVDEYSYNDEGDEIRTGESYRSSITLRDLFAGMAMHAVISRIGIIAIESDVQALAYKAADAMLAERGRESGK